MLSAEFIQKLKQSNISVNKDKTKDRVERLWKSATADQKQAVLELAGVITATVYRIYRTGSISAKLAVPLAQALNVSPLYLTGEVDEPGECSVTALRKLLLKHGYKKLVEKANLKRPYQRKETTADIKPTAPADSAESVEIESEAAMLLAQPQVQSLPPNSETLVEADYQVLFHSLCIQNKAGISTAREKLEQIHLILLS